jgi:membrane fusion protein (multidrug efflux system)
MSKIEPAVLDAASREIDARASRRRKPLFIALGATVAACGLAYGGYATLHAARFVATDNAYVGAETAQVTAALSGIVKDVPVVDTQPVRRGDVVLRLDDTDAALALAQAEAELGRAVRRVRGYVASDDSLAATQAARASDEQRAAAQLAAARADFERARIDLSRRESLADAGAISADELTRVRNAFATAQANLDAAQAAAAQARANTGAAAGSRAANAVLIAGTSEDNNPEVALARARRDQARVNLERTVVRAPVDGVVAKRSVQVGQQVQAGTPLLSVVPLAAVHVDANYK